MNEHTPWETCQQGTHIRPVGEFDIIADVRFGYDVSHDDARKTATDIVRAVNSHEQLVAALEGLMGAIDDASNITGNHGFKKVFSKTVDKCRAALTAAKQE